MGKMIYLEIKNHLKDSVTWIIGIGVLAWALYLFTMNGPLVLNTVSDFHQLLMFWAALLGYRMSSSERAPEFGEWMLTAKSYWKISQVKLRALMTIILFLSFGLNGVLFYSSLAHGIPMGVFQESILAVLLYYTFGMAILGVIGLLIGQLFPQKWGYFFALGIAFFMGQMGFQWLKDMIILLFPGDSPQNFIQLLNLGVNEPEYAYNALYGFEIDTVHWWRRLFLLGMGLLLYHLVQEKHQPKKSWLAGLTAISIIVLTGFFFMDPHQKTIGFSSLESGARQEDFNYYSGANDQSVGEQTIAEWKWKSMDLAVSVDSKLNVTGNGILLIEKQTDRIELSLYHNFLIAKMRLDGKELPFEQKGDRISITAEEMFIPGSSHELSFEYAGYSSIFYFATRKAIYLPSYFNWIPQPYMADAMKESGGNAITLPNYDRNPVKYRITVQGPRSIWLSLPEGKGVSDHGIALVAGQIETASVDRVDYVYTDFHKIEVLRQYVTHRTEEINQVRGDLGLAPAEFTQIIALPFYQEFVGSVASVDRMSKNILYTADGLSAQGETELSYLFVAAAILADEINFMRQNSEIQTLFMVSYESVVSNEISKYLSDEVLSGFLMRTDHGMDFLRAWLQAMSPYREFTKDDLYVLIQEWEKNNESPGN